MNAKTKAKDTLPASVAMAIEEVIGYLWEAEIENFIADEPTADEEHIFRSLVAIDQWFSGHEASPEEVVRRFYSKEDVFTLKARVRSFRGY